MTENIFIGALQKTLTCGNSTIRESPVEIIEVCVGLAPIFPISTAAFLSQYCHVYWVGLSLEVDFWLDPRLDLSPSWWLASSEMAL